MMEFRRFTPKDALLVVDHNMRGGTQLFWNDTLSAYSTVGTYGATPVWEDGKLIFDPRGQSHNSIRGLGNTVDRLGDRLVRRFDEAYMTRPRQMLLDHSQKFWQLIGSGAARRRGEMREIIENARRLGLEHITSHPRGIEITRPEIFTKGINLMDIFRMPENPAIVDLDRFDALRQAGMHIHIIHEAHGAIGEVHPMHIYFQTKADGQVEDPILGYPDIVYDSKRYDARALKSMRLKGIELYDFLLNVATQEMGRPGEGCNARGAIDAVLQGYGDTKVIDAVRIYAYKKRLTLPGDESTEKGKPLPQTITTKLRPLFSGHNLVRLGITSKNARELVTMVNQACCDAVNPEYQGEWA